MLMEFGHEEDERELTSLSKFFLSIDDDLLFMMIFTFVISFCRRKNDDHVIINAILLKVR